MCIVCVLWAGWVSKALQSRMEGSTLPMGVLSSLCSCVTAKFSIRLRPLVTAFQDRTLIWSISSHVESDKTTSGKKVWSPRQLPNHHSCGQNTSKYSQTASPSVNYMNTWWSHLEILITDGLVNAHEDIHRHLAELSIKNGLAYYFTAWRYWNKASTPVTQKTWYDAHWIHVDM